MYMIEGRWSGYHSGQSRIVHREYLPKSRRKFVEAVKSLGRIQFGDGTMLFLEAREVPSRAEPTINGYGEMIRDKVYAAW